MENLSKLGSTLLADENDKIRLRLYLLHIFLLTTSLSYFANLNGVMACAEDYYAE